MLLSPYWCDVWHFFLRCVFEKVEPEVSTSKGLSGSCICGYEFVTTPKVLEFVVEFLCAAVFYIVLHFLPGTEPLYPIQSTPTLSPTWFNFAFRLLTWVEFGLILLLQQLPLVREIHKALAISHFVVLFHKLLEI